MLNVNELIGFGVGGGDTHLYWRVRVTAQASTGTYCSIKEVEMRATVGGADQCNGGTMTFSPGGGTYPEYTTDNNFNTSYLLAYYTYPTPDAWPWFTYQFPSPVSVAEILIAHGSPYNAITACVVEWSDDGIDYTEAKAFTGLSTTAGVAFTPPLGVYNTYPQTLVLTL